MCTKHKTTREQQRETKVKNNNTNNTMQISRIITIYSIFAVCCCTALRLQSDQQYQRNVLRSSSLGDRICWEDGKECDPNTTCINCCTTLSTTDPGTNVTTCGYGCLEDGVVCLNETDYTCNRCCNACSVSELNGAAALPIICKDDKSY